MRILIVEDHPDIGFIMQKLFALAGHQADWATDGYEAIRMAAQRMPAVALLDINLPGIDGYETASELRSRFAHRFPIFAVTASPVDVPLASACGFDGVFAKPFDHGKMTALLHEMATHE
jgi:two-component system, OmpR family, response regulator VicR